MTSIPTVVAKRLDSRCKPSAYLECHAYYSIADVPLRHTWRFAKADGWLQHWSIYLRIGLAQNVLCPGYRSVAHVHCGSWHLSSQVYWAEDCVFNPSKNP